MSQVDDKTLMKSGFCDIFAGMKSTQKPRPNTDHLREINRRSKARTREAAKGLSISEGMIGRHELFWSHVDRRGPDECWEWLGTRTRGGYGRVAIEGGRVVMTHRAAWAITKGDITGGLWVCHKCDNRACCNPGHLFLGTPKDNVQDAIQKGRMGRNAAKLSVEQVRAIFIDPRRGSAIAKEYGLTRTNVYEIFKRHKWTAETANLPDITRPKGRWE